MNDNVMSSEYADKIGKARKRLKARKGGGCKHHEEGTCPCMSQKSFCDACPVSEIQGSGIKSAPEYCPLRMVEDPDDIKARMARAAAVKKDPKTGKVVSSRSKTGSPACSQAMSLWKTQGMSPAIAAQLGKCRAMARQRRAAEGTRLSGNEARAQAWESRAARAESGGLITKKERLAKAKELRASRTSGVAKVEKPAENPKAVGRGTYARQVEADRVKDQRKQSAEAMGRDLAAGTNPDKLRQFANEMVAAGRSRGRILREDASIGRAAPTRANNERILASAARMALAKSGASKPAAMASKPAPSKPAPSKTTTPKAEGRGTPERLAYAKFKRESNPYEKRLEERKFNRKMDRQDARKGTIKQAGSREKAAEILKKQHAEKVGSDQGKRAIAEQTIRAKKREAYRFPLIAAARQKQAQQLRAQRSAQKPATPKAEGRGTRFEAGKQLTKQEREKVLSSVGDVYKDAKLQKVVVGHDNRRDEPIYGYPHSPELFMPSGITGAKVRHYIKLPDGRVAHPSELYPGIKQSHIDKELGNREALAMRLEASQVARQNARVKRRLSVLTDKPESGVIQSADWQRMDAPSRGVGYRKTNKYVAEARRAVAGQLKKAYREVRPIQQAKPTESAKLPTNPARHAKTVSKIVDRAARGKVSPERSARVQAAFSKLPAKQKTAASQQLTASKVTSGKDAERRLQDRLEQYGKNAVRMRGVDQAAGGTSPALQPSLREQAAAARSARMYQDSAGLRHAMTPDHRVQRAEYLRNLRREAMGKSKSATYLNDTQDIKYRIGSAMREMPATSKYGLAFGSRGDTSKHHKNLPPHPSASRRRSIGRVHLN
jgi:hypothetical protein